LTTQADASVFSSEKASMRRTSAHSRFYKISSGFKRNFPEIKHAKQRGERPARTVISAPNYRWILFHRKCCLITSSH